MLDFMREHPSTIVVIGLMAYALGPVLFGPYDPAKERKWYDFRRVDPRKKRK